MLSAHFHRPLFASVVAATLGAHAATAATLSDDFNGDAGSAPDAALWTTSTTNGNAIMTLDGASNIVLDTNIANSSHRAFVRTNDSGFTPFDAPLVIDLDGIAVGGTPQAGFHTGGYVLLGRSASDATSGYYPNGGGMAYGVSVMVRKGTAGYDIHINEYSDEDDDSNPSDGTVLYATHELNGAPTGLRLVIDGANRSVEVQVDGTTFTNGDAASIIQPLSTHFTAANMTVDESLLSRISLGALNAGPTDVGAAFTIDSINIAPIPEPASFALIGAGVLLALGRKR